MRIRHLSSLDRFVLAALVAAALPVAASAQARCEAPRLLLTVDRSSSMLEVLPGGGSKWDAARTAIATVATDYAANIDFGLQVFPYPDRCEPGAITIDVGPNPAAALVDALGDPPPTGGNYTPMSQTLDVAAGYAPILAPERDGHLILVTDGWQWCSGYDGSTRFDPVDSVGTLAAAGVTVHVVGFGAAVDALTLNRAAMAAGTARAGCDPTLEDPRATGHCYHQADDLTDLRAILGSIARDITMEVCDGHDNDCDGATDEGFDVDGDGYTVCGAGPETPGEREPGRADCDDADAAVHPGAEEICDARDNDCDGVTDPGCACSAGDEQPCGGGTGDCTRGTQSCAGGRWGECLGAGEPAPVDACDGLDGDCDGTVDEDSMCPVGSSCMWGACIENDLPGGGEPEPEPETGLPAPMQHGGCGCEVPGSEMPRVPGAAVSGLLLGLLALRRRR